MSTLVFTVAFQSLVSPGRLMGLVNPRTVLVFFEKLTAASFSFIPDCISLPLLEPQPNPVVSNGLRQKIKKVSHRLSPFVHAPSPSSQHAPKH